MSLNPKSGLWRHAKFPPPAWLDKDIRDYNLSKKHFENGLIARGIQYRSDSLCWEGRGGSLSDDFVKQIDSRGTPDLIRSLLEAIDRGASPSGLWVNTDSQTFTVNGHHYE